MTKGVDRRKAKFGTRWQQLWYPLKMAGMNLVNPYYREARVNF